MLVIILVLLLIPMTSLAAVDKATILAHIDAAQRSSPISKEISQPQPSGAIGASPPRNSPDLPQTSSAASIREVPEAIRSDRVRRLGQEQAAAMSLRSTCEGRFNLMRFDLRRSVSRSEKVSIAGGLLGVFGAIATCPHCAAIGAGLAGLANPLQQTFRENGDAPESHRAKLTALSEAINDELTAYRNLPAADPDNDMFEKNLRARLDALLIATASCEFYEKTAVPTSSPSTK